MAVLRLAWWRARRWRHGQAVLWAALVVAVSGVVCVGTMVASVEATLARESRAMLGGDLVCTSNRHIDDAAVASISDALPDGSEQVLLRSTTTMVRSGDQVRPVQLETMPVGYPFAGTLICHDASGALMQEPAALLTAGHHAIVQPELLELLGIAVGDRLTLGSVDLTIVGTVIQRPGQTAFWVMSGPVVLVADDTLEATGLVGLGARVRHRLLIGLDDVDQGEPTASVIRSALGIPEDDRNRRFRDPRGNDTGIAVRTAGDSSDQLQRSLRRLGDFLHLSVLIAALLAGVGITVLVDGALRAGRQELASLRLLGAGPSRARAILVWQYGLVALSAGLVGALVGGGLAWGGLQLAQPWLPIAIVPVWSWSMSLTGVGLAVVLAVTSCAAAITSWAALPAAAIVRGDPPRGRVARVVGALVLVGVLIAFGAWQARSWLMAGGVVGGTVVAGVVLWALARLVLALLGRVARRAPPVSGWGRALRSATRPQRRGALVIAASGLAALLLALVAIHETSLAQRLQHTGGDRTDPGLFIIDVQQDQVAGVRQWLAAEHPWSMEQGAVFHPYLRARLRAVGDQGPPAAAVAGRRGERRDWAWFREHNLSYRHELSPDETIVAGDWPAPAGIDNWCSLSDDMAEMLDAEVGDRITFEAQGVPLEVVVTSIRHIEWSFYPNFFVLLAPELLQGAPLTWVGATPTRDRSERIAIQLGISRQWANITAYDVEAITTAVDDLVSKVLVVIRGMGLFTLAAGMVVLVGLAMGSLAERQREAALLRALGARRALLRRELAWEHVILGSLAGGGGVLLAVVLAAALLPPLFELPVAIPVAELAVIAIAVVIVVVVTAWSALRRVYAVSSAQVLRDLVDS